MSILQVVFLALLHTHIWFTWAKNDHYAAKAGKSIFSLKRIVIFLIPTLLTILSIIVVKYPVPDNWIGRLSIDIVAV